MIFLERLEMLLEERNISAYKMSIELQLNKNAVSAWREKNNLPNGDTLQKIADYFDVSVDYLLGRSNIRRPGEIAAASSTIPYDQLPPEALDELRDYMKFLRMKYGKKKE